MNLVKEEEGGHSAAPEPQIRALVDVMYTGEMHEAKISYKRPEAELQWCSKTPYALAIGRKEPQAYNTAEQSLGKAAAPTQETNTNEYA